METDPVQRALILEMLEITFIKNFSYQFEEGEKSMIDIIQRSNEHTTIVRLLHVINPHSSQYDRITQPRTSIKTSVYSTTEENTKRAQGRSSQAEGAREI